MISPAAHRHDPPAGSVANPSARQKLIVALDYPSERLALDLVDRLEGRVAWYKVGLELYLACGGSILSKLQERGLSVFLDLKLHDIPNTVAGAVRILARSGASLLTVHAAGGPAMLAAAAEAAALDSQGPRLLAVTVLTSMDQTQLRTIGVADTPEDQVLRLAASAVSAGIAGLVCSPLEVRRLRAEIGTEPLLVVPGIRPDGSAAGDQQRVAGPAEAIVAGASMLVVGRPITQADDPARAVDSILDQIAGAV